MNVLTSSYIYWCLALVVCIPLAVVFLNESIDRSRRENGSFADALSMIRDVMLPLFVAVVTLRYVIAVSDDNLPTKLISTVFWSVLIISIFRLSRRLVGSGEYPADDWRGLVPHMFLRLPPYVIVGYIVYHVIQNLWAFPVREMAATLGIGSIVIAFALQDTLSNLVSGLLLVANSPFKTGDWVSVGDVEGQITGVNWRYTNIQTISGDLIVIPNGSIAGESIKNFSRPMKSTSVLQKFLISFEHSPNQIRDVFVETLSNTDGVLRTPEPTIDVTNVDDPAMEYLIEYWVEDYGQKPVVHGKLMSNLWYAFQRHGITMPTTQYDVHNYSGVIYNSALEKKELSLKSCLNWLPNFSKLPQLTRSRLAELSAYQRYSAQETVINQLDSEQGLFVIVNGSVSYGYGDQQGNDRLQTLGAGEFFGETGLFGRATSPVKVVAIEDTEILCIPHSAINDVINTYPDFASSISLVIDERRSQTPKNIKGVLAKSEVIETMEASVAD